MRTICAATILVMLMAGAVSAEETKDTAAATQAAPVAAKEKAGVMTPIDTSDDDQGGTSDERSGVNEGRVLPTYETYDPNTGLSDNVPSDAVGNLE